MSAAQRLAGKVGIVTGGAAGIGRAVCERFAQEGASVVVADYNRAGAETVAAAIGKAGGQAMALPADVTDKNQVDELIAKTVVAYGQLDVIHNNAGIMQVKPLLDLTEEDWDRVQAVNLKGTLFGIQAAARQMIAQGNGGRIICTASAAARRPNPLFAHYSASKGALVNLVQSSALAFAPHRITVNSVCPGIVATAMWEHIDKEINALEGWPEGEAMRRRLEQVPLRRPEEPSDVAGLVAFLASDDAAYITGQAYNVTGGMVMN
ncbi:MAG: hypothetical protein CL878_08995, partial [Dehalococcoidia bacterium]|nr:hypothetical protein [Dehalococcoidia bacterium]